MFLNVRDKGRVLDLLHVLIYICLPPFILGDPGAVSRVSRNGTTKVFYLSACPRVLAEDDVCADDCNYRL